MVFVCLWVFLLVFNWELVLDESNYCDEFKELKTVVFSIIIFGQAKLNYKTSELPQQTTLYAPTYVSFKAYVNDAHI